MTRSHRTCSLGVIEALAGAHLQAAMPTHLVRGGTDDRFCCMSQRAAYVTEAGAGQQ
jgi:hypothetical protein